MLPEEPAKLLNRAEGLKEVIWTLLKAEDLNVTNWMIHDFLLDLSQGQCPQLNVQMGKGTKKLFTKYRLLCCWKNPKVHWPIEAYFFYRNVRLSILQNLRPPNSWYNIPNVSPPFLCFSHSFISNYAKLLLCQECHSVFLHPLSSSNHLTAFHPPFVFVVWDLNVRSRLNDPDDGMLGHWELENLDQKSGCWTWETKEWNVILSHLF